jgi:hypothetical protein
VLKVIALLPDEADVVELVQLPPYVMVPASVELKVYAGVVSLSGVVTAVTSTSIGAVVSVVVVLSVVVISTISSSSLLEEQEIKIVKPIQETNKI